MDYIIYSECEFKIDWKLIIKSPDGKESSYETKYSSHENLCIRCSQDLSSDINKIKSTIRQKKIKYIKK